MTPNISKSYSVRKDSQVTLKLTIGNGQKATTTITLDSVEIVKDEKNSFEFVLHELGEKLKGKVLYCVTMVSDFVPETNETSVTYEMTGGRSDFKITLNESVDMEAGKVHYVASFNFI